ncbi:MAG: thioredoxin domain-containing protein [Candidatus Omnitrophota bacterium]
MSTERPGNRLAKEKSPYLLQHAFNPVDWYPWGPEAFQKAQRENKPVFLSIGYSTCHWCHVMEQESFENETIAELLNGDFVAIKVDREERPDLDYVYMRAVMAMTGAGGWPLSVFLTPEMEPFYGGTYFPSEDRWGRPGFYTVLERISERWKADPAKIRQSGEQVMAALRTQIEEKTTEPRIFDLGTFRKAYEELSMRFDAERGGFGPAPKFPQPHVLSFLLRYWDRTRDAEALAMVEKTLAAMARGGIRDHLGGGFHRYSTDPDWHVPHFEKMLYDQAMLARAYLEAYQATGKDLYQEAARDIFHYVLRDMTDSKGGFYSAEDADSVADPQHPEKKTEGAFYLWSETEVRDVLGEELFPVFREGMDIRPGGNTAPEAGGEFSGKNILRIVESPENAARKAGKKAEEGPRLMGEAKALLLQARNSRLRPSLDDKILTDWNGLMISSLALGASALDDAGYRHAAKRAADFVLKEMKTRDGRLFHRWRDGDAAVPGFLSDYAFLALGLLDLYEATFEIRYFQEAVSVADKMIDLFWDEEGKGFFFASRDAEKAVQGAKEIYDSAVPSGNSVAAWVLARLARMTMNEGYETRARETFEAFSQAVSEMPSGHAMMLSAFDLELGPSREIVLAGRGDDLSLQAMAREIRRRYLPNKVLLFHSSALPDSKTLEKLAPFTRVQTPVEGQVTAYVCENYMCKLPVTRLESLKQLLEKKP